MFLSAKGSFNGIGLLRLRERAKPNNRLQGVRRKRRALEAIMPIMWHYAACAAQTAVNLEMGHLKVSYSV